MELGTVGLEQTGEGVLVAAAGAVTTLRQPTGPSRGSSSTAAPSRRARSVVAATSSTCTYGTHMGSGVAHSTTPPPPKPPPSASAV